MELRDDAQRVGLAAALGGTIMFFGFLILVMLSFAYAYALITAGIWSWAAFLIVAGTWAVLAAICALVIRAQAARGNAGCAGPASRSRRTWPC